MKLFLAGYTGQTPKNLLATCERLNACVIDIRFARNSRAPRWRGLALAAALPARYTWFQEWGNVRYRVGPPIQIKDLEGGYQRLLTLMERNPSFDAYILLCACRSPSECHRSILGEYLESQGHTVMPLLWLKAPMSETAKVKRKRRKRLQADRKVGQLTLFDERLLAGARRTKKESAPC